MARTISGKCHCGDIAFELRWPPAQGDIAVRACGCDFCVKHGGVYTSHPQGVLNVRIGDSTAVNKYRFGTQTADFYICTNCGAVPFVTSTIDRQVYAVVNANTFENIPREQLQQSSSDFSGESTQERLARRRRNWIATVSIE